MSLMKELLKESAAAGATSAGAVAGFRSPIGASKKKAKKIKNREKKVRSRLAPVGMYSTLKFVREASSTFDPAAVMAKMSAAEDKAKHGDDTQSFALEDEDDNIVKVTVAKDQAEDFENALARALHGDEESDGMFNDEQQTSSKEIAEILFDLKDRFTIVDIEWPEIEEDQEEDATDAEGGEEMGAEGGEGGDLEDPEGGDAEGGEDGDLEDPEGGEDGEGMEADGGEEYDQMSALSQVIDLLKAQQDAQRAEAEADTAKAEAEKAKAERDEAMAKVRQEEQLLDMESYYKKRKEGDKEAKRLAQLAKWKHDMSADEDPDDDAVDMRKVSSEQEEATNDDTDVPSGRQIDVYRDKIDKNEDGKLDPDDFIRYLFKYLRAR